MPRPSLGVGYPLAVLGTLVAFVSVETAAFAYRGQALPHETEALWALLVGVAWSWWVSADRQRNRRSTAFEFDALVFFAWPVVVPYYLVTSRGGRSTRSSLAIWGFYAWPFLVAIACYVVI